MDSRKNQNQALVISIQNSLYNNISCIKTAFQNSSLSSKKKIIVFIRMKSFYCKVSEYFGRSFPRNKLLDFSLILIFPLTPDVYRFAATYLYFSVSF